MDIRINVNGVSKLTRRLESLGNNAESIIDNALENGARAVQKTAKRLVPYKTGTLKNSITVSRVKPCHYTVGTNVSYAKYVEFGTGSLGDPSVPHTLRKTWRYKTRSGEWVTCKGIKARPFIRPAAEQNKEYIVKLVKAQIKMALKGQTNGGVEH